MRFRRSGGSGRGTKRAVTRVGWAALMLVAPLLSRCSSSSGTNASPPSGDSGSAGASGASGVAGNAGVAGVTGIAGSPSVDGGGSAGAGAAIPPESINPAWLPTLTNGTETTTPFTVPVYINHSYRTVPQATFDAFGSSTWLNQEFATVEQRTTDSGDAGSYTGAYPTFERTYLELLVEGASGSPSTPSGLGLGDETAGGFDLVSQAFVAEFTAGGVTTSDRNHVLNGQFVPWFHITSINGSHDLAPWNMEYVTPDGQSAPPTRLQNRADLYDPSKLARNVVALRYGLPPADMKLLRRALTVVGWDVTSDDVSFFAYSPDDNGIRRLITAVPATDTAYGLVMVGISLNRVPDYHQEQLGDATLTVGENGLALGELWYVPH